MARLHEAYFDLTHAGFLRRVASIFRLLGYSLELIVLNAAGVVNAWGRSISRPFLIGAAIIAVYALAYFNVDKPPSWSAAVIKSTEVTLLVGYTNHSQATLALGPHLSLGLLVPVLRLLRALALSQGRLDKNKKTNS